MLSACLGGCGDDGGNSTPLCGNGHLETGEDCDDGNPGDGDGCSRTCAVEPGWACVGTPSTCERLPGCGNGHLDAGEDCDSEDLSGVSCADLGFSGGALACTADCAYDLAGCEPCGNDAAGAGEACDGPDFAGGTCESLGFSGGTLACTAGCDFDFAGCSVCGNGALEAGEACDSPDLAGGTCESLGFSGGTLACTAGCDYDLAGCSVCGNGALEAGEDCDGTDLDGETCVSLGYPDGVLACDADCYFDRSDCGPQADGRVGDPCTARTECGGISGGLTAACLNSFGGFFQLSGGYCTAFCTEGDPDPCATSGGVCVMMITAYYCVKPCADSGECREAEGYSCQLAPMGGSDTYCLPPM